MRWDSRNLLVQNLHYSTALSILYIGFSLLFGTHVECKTICFLRKPRPQRTAFSNLFRTAIDDLILFEHQGGNSIRIKRARTNGPN